MALVSGLGVVALNAVNGPLSLADGTILCADAGLACFLTEDAIAFQDLRNGGACLSWVNPYSGVILPLDPLGANVLVAGAGVWAAYGGGGAYRDSYGHTAANWLPLAVDASTGFILVSITNGWTDSQLGLWDGRTLSLLSYSGAPLQQGTADDGLAVVQVGATPVPFPWQSWPALQLINFDLSDGWLAGWSPTYNGLVCWEVGSSPMGYVLAVNQNRFGAAVAVQANGHVLVAASTGAGELPGELVTYDIDPDAQTVNGQKAILLDLTKSAAQPFVMPTFAKTTHRIAIGLVGEDMIDPTAPQITAPGFLSPNTVGAGCTLSHDKPPYVQASSDLAASLAVPWYPYWDGTGYDLDKMPAYGTPDRTVPLAQCYIRVGEPLPVSALRWRSDIRRLRKAYPTVGVVAQGYRGQRGDGSYAFTEQQVADSWAELWPLCLTEGVSVIHVFEYDRADGLRSQACANLFRTLDVWRLAVPDWTAFPLLEDDDMISVKQSMLQPYWEWPATHVVIQGADGTFLVPDRSKGAAGVKWVKAENKPSGGLLSGEAWQLQGQKAVAEGNGATYSLKVT